MDEPGTGSTTRQRREMFRNVFEHSPTPTALSDLDGRCLHVNRAMSEMTGYAESVLRDHALIEIVHPDDAETERALSAELLAGQKCCYRLDQRYFTADGRTEWCQKAVGVLRDDDGKPLMLVVQFDDISERKRIEERLRRLADYDSLTGLRNRRVFEDHLGVQVSRCKRYGEHAALLLIDVDDFKQINDSYGHVIGDQMLAEMAAAIRGRVRSGDVAARIGGDEFAVLLAHVDRSQTTKVLQDLRRVLRRCAIETDSAVISTSASIGAVVLDETTDSARAAIHDADLDMYRAKRRRRRLEQRFLSGDPDPLLAA